MKIKPFFIAIATALLAGCATQESVLKNEGAGTKRTFPEPEASVWKSAVNACRHGDLSLISANPTNHVIQAQTHTRMESWGEFVAVWVRPVDATNTEVEVVSRQRAPSGMFAYNWERQILNDIAADFGQAILPDPPSPRPDPGIPRQQ